MTHIINLQTRRKAHLQARAKGVTLCRTGFHKWQVLPEQRFDVRQGQLITTECCQRCNEQRTRLALRPGSGQA